MSRGLLLDTINELNTTAAERAKALAEDVFLETYSILVYNQSMEFIEPAKNTRDAQHLFIALQNWEQQTSAFLDELSQRADTFIADPDLIHDLAGNLTLLMHAATDFARNFRDLIPAWAEEISKTIADLLNSFHGTLTVFSQIT
ncbi:hypothetical protein Daus18300_008446 [Diaporthe australafricana]|uniref:Uncharacterized protein n=1 Tax=Diaporthe australafricana TaxID=127596 RepID=A0ABR3WIL4_9PEZI